MDNDSARKVIKTVIKEVEEVKEARAKGDGSKRRKTHKTFFSLKPKDVSTHTFELINDIVSLRTGGYQDKLIAVKVGVNQSHVSRLMEKHPHAFTICEREALRLAQKKLGITLAGYSHAMNELMPTAIRRLKEMLDDETSSRRDIIDATKLLVKVLGVGDPERLAKEAEHVETQLIGHLESVTEEMRADVIPFKR